MRTGNNCLICGGSEARPLVADLMRCSACGAILSLLDPDYSLYGREYHEKYVRYSRTELGRAISAERWEFVSRNMPGGGKLLDYGCGSGHFIDTNPNGKFHVAGYDVNPFSGRSAQEVLRAEFDGVTFWDSLERVPVPKALIAGLSRPEWVFLTVPDCSSVLGEQIMRWRHYRPGEHLHYFTPESLCVMLRGLGYSVREVNRKEAILRNPDEPDWLISVAAKRTS